MENLAESSVFMTKTIAVSHAERPKAPPYVWDWQAYPTWKNVIWELVDEIVDDRVKQTFLASSPEYVVGDDLSWLDNIILAVQSRDVDSKAWFSRKLRSHFRSFRAVHGSRVSDFLPYYQKGLVLLEPEAFHEQARNIFLTGRFPELTEADLEKAIDEVGTELREGRVWFEGNERLLVEHCGHYMLYGSEYLLAIAANLGNQCDYRQVLKEVGEPVVFVCDVPLTLMHSGTLEEFSGMALAMVFQELLDGANFMPEVWQGAGFGIYDPLPADCIVGHYRPVIARDPIT